MKAYANDTINSMTEAEERLKQYLGTQFNFLDWKPAFDAVFAAEKDTGVAITAIDNLANKAATQTTSTPSTPQSSVPATASPHNSHSNHQISLPQLNLLEADLMKSIDMLHAQNWI
jgi:hypothetical protein